MPDHFDLPAYLAALRARWATILVVTLAAAGVAFAFSLLLPKKYEASVLMTIQPGALGASNPAAMSPAYLDSLRSYEQFVTSEGLVAKLLSSPAEVDSFRRSSLRATLGRGTRTLQLTVRDGDPQRAHDLAVKLAQLAVEANNVAGRAESDQARSAAEKEAEGARPALVAAQTALEQFRRTSREEELWHRVDQQIENQSRYQTQLNDAQVNLTEQEARLRQLQESNSRDAMQIEATRTDIAGLRARSSALRESLKAIGEALARSQAELATTQTRRYALEREYQTAERRFNALAGRVTDTGITLSMRHEDLQIADAGVAPSRPVSPRVMLNTLLGALLGALAAILYVSRIA